MVPRLAGPKPCPAPPPPQWQTAVGVRISGLDPPFVVWVRARGRAPIEPSRRKHFGALWLEAEQLSPVKISCTQATETPHAQPLSAPALQQAVFASAPKGWPLRFDPPFPQP